MAYGFNDNKEKASPFFGNTKKSFYSVNVTYADGASVSNNINEYMNGMLYINIDYWKYTLTGETETTKKEYRKILIPFQALRIPSSAGSVWTTTPVLSIEPDSTSDIEFNIGLKKDSGGRFSLGFTLDFHSVSTLSSNITVRVQDIFVFYDKT